MLKKCREIIVKNQSNQIAEKKHFICVSIERENICENLMKLEKNCKHHASSPNIFG